MTEAGTSTGEDSVLEPTEIKRENFMLMMKFMQDSRLMQAPGHPLSQDRQPARNVPTLPGRCKAAAWTRPAGDGAASWQKTRIYSDTYLELISCGQNTDGDGPMV